MDTWCRRLLLALLTSAPAPSGGSASDVLGVAAVVPGQKRKPSVYFFVYVLRYIVPSYAFKTPDTECK